MLFLRNDYSEGMHDEILKAIIETNSEQQIGYTCDEHTKNACEMIKKRIGKENADVHLITGGTQVNTIAITAFLRPVEAVIATNLAHIAVHETGAIEARGHKIIEMPTKDSKLTPKLILEAVNSHVDEHMVVPKMVYISNVTEIGTIYTKSELIEISKVCKENNLYLYLDGARLSNALTAYENDLTLEDIANLCDAFYIGATKNGAMFGEALIILNDSLKPYIRHYIKQAGAMLAKGRYLGIQFETLMKDDLFLKISKHTNEMAKLLKDGIKELGLKFVVEPQSNLIFVALPKYMHEKLQNVCHYECEADYDENHVEARFVTSWATPKEDVLKFLEVLKEIY